MCAIYAFMRYSDDISDDGSPPLENRQKRLDAWRAKLADALAGRFGNDPVLPAFAAAIDRYDIPRSYFTELIDGMQSDLRPAVYRTFDELYRYCYQARLGGRPDHDSRTWIRQAGGAATGPRNAASPFNSPTSCATSRKTPDSAASICGGRPRTFRTLPRRNPGRRRQAGGRAISSIDGVPMGARRALLPGGRPLAGRWSSGAANRLCGRWWLSTTASCCASAA